MREMGAKDNFLLNFLPENNCSIFLNVSIPFNRVRTEKSWPRAREKVVKIVTKPDTKTNTI